MVFAARVKWRIEYNESRRLSYHSVVKQQEYHSDEVGIQLKFLMFCGDDMSNSVMRDRSKEFAKNVVFLCRKMRAEHKEAVIINQLLRSGTSIGANIHEAQYAQGTKDFISKLEIAQKECYETEYWLELLFETGCMEEREYKFIRNECGAIRRMLIASLTTVKSNPK